jgi:two-component system cell cycle sensor histidine kinase/response regulator CckA
VTDTGTGILTEIAEKIFEPFFTTKEVGKGTGLGLSTIMGIVETHHGFVTFDSKMGKGTVFHVYIPTDSLPHSINRDVAFTAPRRGTGEVILLVDDENSILTVTSEILTSFGFNVRTASNGAEGLALYLQNPQTIAAIITDMSMPVMDGPSMIESIRNINPKAKIIASSGFHDDQSLARVADAGIARILKASQ